MRDRIFLDFLKNSTKGTKSQSLAHQVIMSDSIGLMRDLSLPENRVLHKFDFQRGSERLFFLSNLRGKGLVCRPSPGELYLHSKNHRRFIHEIGSLEACTGFTNWLFRDLEELFPPKVMAYPLLNCSNDYHEKCEDMRCDPIIDVLGMSYLGKTKDQVHILYDSEEYIYLYGHIPYECSTVKAMKDCPLSTFHIIPAIPKLELFISSLLYSFLKD